MVVQREEDRMYMTVEEFLHLCEQSTQRYEYIRGRAYLMAGGSPIHALLIKNTLVALTSALGDEGPCIVYSSDTLVQLADDVIVTPDATVSCERSDLTADMIYHPKVVVEVLSPNTKDYDLGRKFLYYMECPTVQAVIFIDYDGRLVTIDQRIGGLWDHMPHYSGGNIEIRCLNVTIPVDAIYQNAPF